MAGGLYIGEFGQPNMGAANAGAQAIAEDASTAVQNAAGIMFLENKRDILLTLAVIDASVDFRVDPATTISPATDGGDAGDTALAGAFFYTRKFGNEDKFGFGFSLASVSAAIVDYEDPANFAGRYWGQKVEMLTITGMPSFAYQVNDQWSVSVGVPVMFGSLDMDVAIPSVMAGSPDGQAVISSGDDTQAGINLGVMWQATQRLRFGLTYQSELEMNFNSDLQVTLPPMLPPPVGQIETKADVQIPFVQTVRGSFASDMGDRLTILGSIAWEDWSSFQNVLISTDAGPTGALPRDWDDTWRFALGLRYRTGGPWTFYAGAAYDTDPTSSEERTPDMPIDRQIRISVGTTYAKSEKFKIGGAITYADNGDAKINNSSLGTPPGQLVGDYGTNRIIFVGLNFNWK